jgi:hypothetical protein
MEIRCDNCGELIEPISDPNPGVSSDDLRAKTFSAPSVASSWKLTPRASGYEVRFLYVVFFVSETCCYGYNQSKPGRKPHPRQGGADKKFKKSNE